MSPPLLIEAGSPAVLEEAEEDEDSFFELQIALPPSDDDNICSMSTSKSITVETGDSTRSECYCDCSDEEKHASSVLATTANRRCKDSNFPQRIVSTSPGEKSLSKRKILPIVGLYRPQSPISLLKSAPKFRVFIFAKSKSTATAKGGGKKQGRDRRSAQLALSFKVKEIQPFFFERTGSLRKGEKEPGNEKMRRHCSVDLGASKRFSRDVIQKYLRLVKPLYGKASKKQGNGETFTEKFTAATTSSSPPLLAGRGKPPLGTQSKQFGKSRSTPAAIARVVSLARMDDSLLQQHDGIQSAILHCKRSFGSSRDLSPLSRWGDNWRLNQLK